MQVFQAESGGPQGPKAMHYSKCAGTRLRKDIRVWITKEWIQELASESRHEPLSSKALQPPVLGRVVVALTVFSLAEAWVYARTPMPVTKRRIARGFGQPRTATY